MGPASTNRIWCFMSSYLFGLIFLSASAASAATSHIDTADEIISEMQNHLVWDYYQQWARDLDWERLRDFYSKRDFLPVWVNSDQSTRRASTVRDTLLNSHLEGLEPNEYHAAAIRTMWNARKARSRARLELLLTDGFLRYGVEVSIGYQNPKSVDYDWHVVPQQVDSISRLEALLISDSPQSFLESLPPPQPAYAKLKQTLAYYRQLALGGDWRPFNHGQSLQVGMRHSDVSLIKARLVREAYLSNNDNTNSDYFDETLSLAVRQFQANHGHKVDGIVGPYTRQSMSVSLWERIASLKQNMERWRWVPRELGERYVMVNMAGYKLDLIDRGKVILEMPVIVGKPYRAAPAFIDNIDYVEINPTWKVPPRIAKEKFLPKIQADPKFLARNRLRIYDSWGKKAKEVDPTNVNWSKYNERWLPYKFVQDPGKHNSMGLVKFMFPNKYRIYLHDTPQKKLFNRYVRTFSSGCIRVSQPFTLANKILEKEKSWGGKKIQSLINGGETKIIRMKEPLPVYLMYWTAWVDENGRVNFRKDVYQRNKRIAISAEMAVS